MLLTDGADDPLRHLEIPVETLANLDQAHLARVLADLHRWESDYDPNGQHLRRFKRHDDKTIVIMDFR